MRILHVINRCGIANGAAKLILDIAAHHKQKGYIVDILTLVAIQPSYERDFVKLGCSYKALFPQGHSMKDPRILLKLRKIMREYDVIHAHLFPAFYWLAVAKVIFNSKCKLIFTEHASENNRRKRWLRPIEIYIYKQYDRIIAISHSVKYNLQKHLLYNCDIDIIANGVNIVAYRDARSNLRQKLGLSEHDKVIMQVAGFRPEKDQMTVLKAIQLLPDNFHVVFVGGGKLLDLHVNTAKEMGLINRCHFLGIRNDVPELLQASDIVVVASHFEGFGLAAVEGMASRKPVLASNVPGVSEVVDNAGILFEPNNAPDLAQKVLSLCMNSQSYNTVVERCYKRALSYDISLTAEQYEKQYKRLINDTGRE